MYFGPPNDVVVAATQLSGSSGRVTGSNRGATREYGEPTHHPSGSCQRCGGASVWWRWTAPADGLARFGAGESDFEYLLAIYTRPGQYFYRVRNENSRTPETFYDIIASAGTTYYVAVDRNTRWNGNVTLTWQFTPAPANDDFDAGQVITGVASSCAIAAEGDQSVAAWECGVCRPGDLTERRDERD